MIHFSKPSRIVTVLHKIHNDNLNRNSGKIRKVPKPKNLIIYNVSCQEWTNSNFKVGTK